jgi:excisionase family DNA binding protein
MADARGSGPRERKLMGVQIPPSAPTRDTIAAGYAMAEISEYISTQTAADRAGLTRAHIRRLLERGTLQGQRFGRDWMVYAPALAAYAANRPRPGLKLGQMITRPRKVAHA